MIDQKVVQGLYIAATDYCIQEGRNEAWLFEKKFAELIVNECAAVQERSSTERHGYDKYSDGETIKKHFGVQNE